MIKLLDHGYVTLINHMGDDNTIVRAARTSYAGGTKTKREDSKLLEYLWKNKHLTPFEMCEFHFQVKAPIFVARQWFRHRAASYNEVSGRYSVMEDQFYIPKTFKAQSLKNKQCSGEELPEETQDECRAAVEKVFRDCYQVYTGLLERGVSREIARTVLPLSLYTEFQFKMDLRNLLNFIDLRNHSHAQEEIRVYAQAILDLIEPIVPETIRIFKQ